MASPPSPTMLLVLEVIREGREAQIALSKRGAGWASLLHLAEVQGWASVVQLEDKTCSLALTEEGKKALSPQARQAARFEAAVAIARRDN